MSDSVHIEHPSNVRSSPWTRRNWLTTNGAALMAAYGTRLHAASQWRGPRGVEPDARAEHLQRSALLENAPAWEALATQAVDAARAAGATYADARLTRIVQHLYRLSGSPGDYFSGDTEMTGVGIRALVNGYWGFAAAPRVDADTVVKLAQNAVAQAKVNALGSTRAAELARCPAVRGTWATPIHIDPFTISIEEKNDYITSWMERANRLDVGIDTIRSGLQFARQERVVATSEGSLFTQRLYESAGTIICTRNTDHGTVEAEIDGIQAAGKGWDLILDAKIRDQLTQMRVRLDEEAQLRSAARPLTVGRYTIVCDGATMAALLDQTLGLATQVDRAMGFEANASGTSFIDDPLQMLGSLNVASPAITVTGNRSVPTQLATVKWDDEGVVPQTTTLVKDGVLNDFQTTREQASWLAPFYERQGRTVASHGYAASESALAITMQQSPNLALTPSTGTTTLDDLIASVPNGLLVTKGTVKSDFQARNGTLYGTFRKIVNGRLGPMLTGGAALFSTQELWKSITAVASERAHQSIVSSQYPFGSMVSIYGYTPNIKGQPPQITGHTVTAPAAVLTKQAIVDPTRKA